MKSLPRSLELVVDATRVIIILGRAMLARLCGRVVLVVATDTDVGGLDRSMFKLSTVAIWRRNCIASLSWTRRFTMTLRLLTNCLWRSAISKSFAFCKLMLVSSKTVELSRFSTDWRWSGIKKIDESAQVQRQAGHVFDFDSQPFKQDWNKCG